jgi:hypothetical protein
LNQKSRGDFILRTIVGILLGALSISGACAEGRTAKRLDHVYIIVLENHGFDDALYGPSPFLFKLTRTQGVATFYFGVTHPSLPNYLAMVAGDDFGVRDNDPSCFASDLQKGQKCQHMAGDTLVDQLEAKGLSWAMYAENLPSIGSLQSREPNALYVQKHNPFVYFDQIATSTERLKDIKTFHELAVDLAGAAPNFVFIVPNQCNDGHGLPRSRALLDLFKTKCSDDNDLIRAYDAFVQSTVQAIQASSNWTENSAIVIVFDEGEAPRGTAGGPSYVDCCSVAGSDIGGHHVPAIVVTKCGGPVTSGTPSNHYSLLATIEEGFGLSRLRKATTASTMWELFNRDCM